MSKGTKISSGDLAEIYLWGDDKILKLFWGSRLGMAEAEAACSRAAHAAGVQAPAVIDIVEVENREGILYERVIGPTMRQEIAQNPHQIMTYAHQLAELHVSIHTRTAPPNLLSLKKQFSHRIRQTVLLPGKMKQDLLAILDALPPGNALCHGDFHPGNVLLTADGPVVIDWPDATRGNPLADMVRTSLVTQPRTVTADTSPSVRLFTTVHMRLFHAMYLKRYEELRPIDHEQLTTWELPVIASRLAEFSPEEARHLVNMIELAFVAHAQPA